VTGVGSGVRPRALARRAPGPGSNVPPREVAIQADVHDPAGPHQRSKNTPTLHRVGKMVEHSDAFDQIEGFACRSELQNVSLRVFDIPYA